MLEFVLPHWFLVAAIRSHGTRPLATLAFQPPHSANRHDAGCRGAGADCLAAVITEPIMPTMPCDSCLRGDPGLQPLTAGYFLSAWYDWVMLPAHPQLVKLLTASIR